MKDAEALLWAPATAAAPALYCAMGMPLSMGITLYAPAALPSLLTV